MSLDLFDRAQYLEVHFESESTSKQYPRWTFRTHWPRGPRFHHGDRAALGGGGLGGVRVAQSWHAAVVGRSENRRSRHSEIEALPSVVVPTRTPKQVRHMGGPDFRRRYAKVQVHWKWI